MLIFCLLATVTHGSDSSATNVLRCRCVVLGIGVFKSEASFPILVVVRVLWVDDVLYMRIHCKVEGLNASLYLSMFTVVCLVDDLMGFLRIYRIADLSSWAIIFWEE